MDEIDDDLAYAEATDPEEDDSEPNPKVSVPDDLLATTVAGDEGTTEEDVGPQVPVDSVQDALDWLYENVDKPVTGAAGEAGKVLGGGEAGAVADKPGEAPKTALDLFGSGAETSPEALAPDVEALYRESLKAAGLAPPQVDLAIKRANTSQAARDSLDTIITKTPPKPTTPKAPIMTPEQEAAYRAELKKILPPDLAGLVDRTPLSALGNLASSGASKILNPPKPPKPGVAKIDREAAYRAYPELRAYGPGLSDAAISSFFAKRLEEQTKARQAGGVQYKAKPNTNAIKIKNDDAFKRSGLKTGDVVCIRIP